MGTPAFDGLILGAHLATLDGASGYGEILDGALQVGGALLRGADLTRGCQADGSEERVQKTHAVKRF